MRLASYETLDGEKAAGVVIGDEVVPLSSIQGAPTDVIGVLTAGLDGLNRKAADSRERLPLDGITLRAPIPRPSKYLAIGFNFASHLQEIHAAAEKPQFAAQKERIGHLRAAFPDQRLPTFFNKQVSCITGPRDPILAPKDSAMLDYEGELVVVIGKRTRRIDEAAAMTSVAGYTVGNDVSVRDWQQDTPTMWPGKSFDTHGPIGPWVVTADEVDPSDLAIRTWVDDELRQHGRTAEMVTGIAAMIAALSRVCTLEPGDLIATGTPGGVGVFSGKLLRPGQRVRVEIEGIGTIENPVIAEE